MLTKSSYELSELKSGPITEDAKTWFSEWKSGAQNYPQEVEITWSFLRMQKKSPSKKIKSL